MSYDRLLDSVPVWAFFIFIALCALLPIEPGQRLGARRRKNADHDAEGPVGNVVGATLALLGFMVALTVGAATARIDSRKEALIDGVNAIETAYRDAALLPEPHKSECRKTLREYVDFRVDLTSYYNNHDELQKKDARVREMHDALWSHAIALAQQDRSSEIYALFTASLSEVIRIHNKRVIIGSQHRIPLLVWIVLVFVTMITMFGVGFQFGLSGSRSIVANIMLALTFALVISLIFDLEQPAKGFVDVSQQPMIDLGVRLHAQP